MKAVFIYIFLFLSALLVWRNSFATFFAQDDFILISHFSQNQIFTDLKNAMGKPTITHWRPVHNLFFVTAGNLFGKNYYLYHLFVFVIFATAGFGVYQVATLILKNELSAVIAGFLYIVNPLHFVSLFWISGSAPIIGFLFLIYSFYFFLKKNYKKSFVLFLFSFLALESMIVCFLVFLIWGLISKRKDFVFLGSIFLACLVFLIARFTVFSSKIVAREYYPVFSVQDVGAVKYYLLRILGFGETSNDKIASFLVLIFLLSILLIFLRHIKNVKYPIFVFFLAVVLVGLFPFIFLTNHLSPHYMTISLWGFSSIAAYLVQRADRRVVALLLLVTVVSALWTVNITYANNWVTKRSKIAQFYISKIEKNNLPDNSRLIFINDEYPSQEAYISLGEGKAIGFWFPSRKYDSCFSFLQNCL